MDSEDNRWFLVSNAKRWLVAVELQGQRILVLNDIQASLHKNCSREDLKQIKNVMDLSFIDEHFFLIALNKAKRWLTVLKKRGIVEGTFFMEISPYLKMIGDTRNKREHDEEYLTGGGYNRSNWECDVEINGNSHAGRCDASSTIITDAGYLIGGRINVQELMKAVGILLPRLVELEQEELLNSCREV